jgi:thiol-disulfide isomerase/thioredoxin
MRSVRLALLAVFVPLVAGGGAEPLVVSDAAGAPVELALAPGELALVVHFWASWCKECADELPGLERAARACTGAVRVVPVNVGEPLDVALAFRARHGLGLPLLRDPEGRVWRRLAPGLPANLVWTPVGRRVEVGPYAPFEWERRLGALGCATEKVEPGTIPP